MISGKDWFLDCINDPSFIFITGRGETDCGGGSWLDELKWIREGFFGLASPALLLRFEESDARMSLKVYML